MQLHRGRRIERRSKGRCGNALMSQTLNDRGRRGARSRRRGAASRRPASAYASRHQCQFPVSAWSNTRSSPPGGMKIVHASLAPRSSLRQVIGCTPAWIRRMRGVTKVCPSTTHLDTGSVEMRSVPVSERRDHDTRRVGGGLGFEGDSRGIQADVGARCSSGCREWRPDPVVEQPNPNTQIPAIAAPKAAFRAVEDACICGEIVRASMPLRGKHHGVWVGTRAASDHALRRQCHAGLFLPSRLDRLLR